MIDLEEIARGIEPTNIRGIKYLEGIRSFLENANLIMFFENAKEEMLLAGCVNLSICRNHLGMPSKNLVR